MTLIFLKNTKFLLKIVCLLTFLLSFLYLSQKYSFDDYAYFAGDTWQYQSVAVNLIKGHGYKYGGFENFDIYKFKKNTYYKQHLSPQELFDIFYHQQDFFIYKTPLYQLFLALIYKLFGIHPLYVKFIQLVLLCLVSTSLPLLGFLYLKKSGIVPGVISSFIFIKYFCPDPSLVMTESFTIFTFLLWIISFVLWERNTSSFSTLFLGIMTGILILAKAYLLIIPVTFVYLLISIKIFSKFLYQALLFTLGLVISIAPWSICASLNSGQIIIVSGQTRNILLDSNNESSIFTGKWSPGWRRWNQGNPKYLYNRLDDSQYSTFAKLILFLKKYNQFIPLMIRNKLSSACGDMFTFAIFICMFLYYLSFLTCKVLKLTQFKDAKLLTYPLSLFFTLFFHTIIGFGDTRLTHTFMPFFLLPAIYSIIFIIEIPFRLKKIQ